MLVQGFLSRLFFTVWRKPCQRRVAKHFRPTIFHFQLSEQKFIDIHGNKFAFAHFIHDHCSNTGKNVPIERTRWHKTAQLTSMAKSLTSNGVREETIARLELHRCCRRHRGEALARAIAIVHARTSARIVAELKATTTGDERRTLDSGLQFGQSRVFVHSCQARKNRLCQWSRTSQRSERCSLLSPVSVPLSPSQCACCSSL